MPTYLPANAGIELSEAIAEAYASSKIGDPILLTLEFRHASFTDEEGNPISHYIVNDFRELSATDEDSNVRTFLPVPFRFTKPDQSDSGAPKAARIEIDNVSLILARLLMQARESDEPVQVIAREYLPSDTSAPHVIPVTGTELSSPVITVETVSAELGFGNLTNRKFPARSYTAEDFPALAP
jgi:hypothetical protein